MYGGLIIEQGDVRDIFYNSRHPYTWGLWKVYRTQIPWLKERLKPIDGQPPDLFKPPTGCPFYVRCKYSMDVCKNNRPNFYGNF